MKLVALLFSHEGFKCHRAVMLSGVEAHYLKKIFNGNCPSTPLRVTSEQLLLFVLQLANKGFDQHTDQ